MEPVCMNLGWGDVLVLGSSTHGYGHCYWLHKIVYSQLIITIYLQIHIPLSLLGLGLLPSSLLDRHRSRQCTCLPAADSLHIISPTSRSVTLSEGRCVPLVQLMHWQPGPQCLSCFAHLRVVASFTFATT